MELTPVTGIYILVGFYVFCFSEHRFPFYFCLSMLPGVISFTPYVRQDKGRDKWRRSIWGQQAKRSLTLSASSGRGTILSAVGAHTLIVLSIPLVARIVACGWGSKQFTTWLSPSINAMSFPPIFFHMKIRPQSDPLTTYSVLGPKKFTPLTVLAFRWPS